MLNIDDIARESGEKKTLMENFKNQLNYTTCNEDSNSELAVLDIKQNDTLLCVTGSGGRVLNLLTAKPHQIIAIDFNSIQNWLLELKISAIKNLDYKDFRKFMGLEKCVSRKEIFDELLKMDLTEQSRVYWEQNKQIIAEGILFQGVFERNIIRFSRYINKFFKTEVQKMLSFEDLEKQRYYYWNVWNNDHWRTFIKFIPFQDKDLSFDVFVGEKINSNDYILQKFEKGFTKCLVNRNHFFTLVLTGSYKDVNMDCLPLYLQPGYFSELKNNLKKITIVNDDLVSFLQAEKPGSIDKFSISDVSGYISSKKFKTLIKEIVRTGKNKGSFCARNFLVNREIPEEFDKLIERNHGLEKQLNDKDLAFIYSFVVGKIIKH